LIFDVKTGFRADATFLTVLLAKFWFIENQTTLAEVEDKEHNCKKAVKAYQNALKIFTEELYPVYNEIIADNLENLINFCKTKNIKL
jgi:hypothetical protein